MENKLFAKNCCISMLNLGIQNGTRRPLAENSATILNF